MEFLPVVEMISETPFGVSFLFCMLFVLCSGMKRSELYIESKFDGLPISVLEIVPDGNPRAVVYLIHGLCGCKERFLQFIGFLTSNGYACVASDLRGHGESICTTEDRGYMYGGGAGAVVQDIDSVVDHIHEHFTGLPLILLGHSMGSLAARAYMNLHDSRFDALIVCGSPSLNTFTPIAYVFLRSLCGIGYGRRRIRLIQTFISGRYNSRFKQEGYQAWTCSDSKLRSELAEAPRCNFIITADCAATLMELFRETYSSHGMKPERPAMPVIFLSGEDDPCMISREKFLKSMECMRVKGYVSVSYHTYVGMRHEILNEINKEVVWDDILDFITVIA